MIQRLGGVDQRARLHEDLARAVRSVPVVGRAVVAAGDRRLPTVDAVQSVRLRVLGARHGGAADDRRVEAACARAGRRRRRDLRAGHRTRCEARDGAAALADVRRAAAEAVRAAAASAAARAGPGARGAMGDRTARGRRKLGRHPAAVGVFAHCAQCDGLFARSSRDAQGHRGDASLHHRRRRGLALPGVHVAGMGHGVGRARARARGSGRDASGDAPRGELDAARADPRRRARRLAHEVRGNARQRLGVRVRQRRVSGRRRHDDRRAGAARRGRSAKP